MCFECPFRVRPDRVGVFARGEEKNVGAILLLSEARFGWSFLVAGDQVAMAIGAG